MGDRTFERLDEGGAGRVAPGVEGLAHAVEEQEYLPHQYHEEHRRQRQACETQQGEDGGKGLQFSHGANLSCGAGHADAAEGLGVAWPASMV